MKKITLLSVLLLIMLNYCSISEKHMGNNFYHQTSGMPYLEGKTEYLFFGIKPKAYEKSIYISPCLPLDWKDTSIDNVRVVDNSFSLAITQKSDYKEYTIRQKLADWTVIVDVKNSKKVKVNNKEIDPENITGNRLMLTGQEMKVLIY